MAKFNNAKPQLLLYQHNIFLEIFCYLNIFLFIVLQFFEFLRLCRINIYSCFAFENECAIKANNNSYT